MVGPGADAPAAVRAWLASVAVEFGNEIVGFLADLLTGTDAFGGLVEGLGTPDRPFAMALSDAPGAPELLLWFPPDGPEVRATAGAQEALIRAGEEITTWRPGDAGLDAEVLATALRREADVAADVADLIWNRDLAAGIDGLVARWGGGDGRIVPPVTAPAGVSVSTVADAAASQLIDQLDLEQLVEHDPPAVIHVRLASGAAAAFPGAPADRIVDLTAFGRAPETFTVPAPAAGEWFVALAPRAAARLAAGDTDGALGQAARLGRVLAAFALLGPGQVVIAEGGAGHAARQAAASPDGAAVSDVVTLGTPLGPVSLTVLDEAAAGDLWRLLATLAPEPTGAEDDDLALGRALVAALAEVDALGDPAVDLRLPAGEISGRAGLTVHALFGVVGEPAVRRAVTALVAAGLAARARARAAAGVTAATGIRAGLRFPLAGTPTDPLVVGGHVTTDLGGWDLTGTGLQPAPDRAVRLRLRIGARSGWLAGGPDPLRAPQRSREHALRAVTADVTLPRERVHGHGLGTTRPPRRPGVRRRARALGRGGRARTGRRRDPAPAVARGRPRRRPGRCRRPLTRRCRAARGARVAAAGRGGREHGRRRRAAAARPRSAGRAGARRRGAPGVAGRRGPPAARCPAARGRRRPRIGPGRHRHRHRRRRPHRPLAHPRRPLRRRPLRVGGPRLAHAGRAGLVGPLRDRRHRRRPPVAVGLDVGADRARDRDAQLAAGRRPCPRDDPPVAGARHRRGRRRGHEAGPRAGRPGRHRELPSCGFHRQAGDRRHLRRLRPAGHRP